MTETISCAEQLTLDGAALRDAALAQVEEASDDWLCWSRHKDNVGKPRPVAVWSVTYSCANRHQVTANCCDPCASSLVDGRQRCARCVKPMVVSDLRQRSPITQRFVRGDPWTDCATCGTPNAQCWAKIDAEGQSCCARCSHSETAPELSAPRWRVRRVRR